MNTECDNCYKSVCADALNKDGFCEECAVDTGKCAECAEVYHQEEMFRHNYADGDDFLLCGYCNQDPTNRPDCECNWCKSCMTCAECKREFCEDDMMIEDEAPEASACMECWEKREGKRGERFVEDLNRTCTTG
jgi:hypothetical protein